MAQATPLQSRLRALARLFDAINQHIGSYVAWLTLVMVLLTFFIVIMRYVFELNWIWLQESVDYMHAMVFMLGGAYTLKHDGHVRVDIFYAKASKRARAWVDMLGSLFLLIPMMVFILMASWSYVTASWHVLEGSPEVNGLPFVYILKSNIIGLGVLMTLQAIAMAIHNGLYLLGVDAEPEHHTIAELR